MSLIEQGRPSLEELQSNYPEELLKSLHIGDPETKALGHIERIQQLAESKIGGFVCYFVVGDPYHDLQYKILCNMLDIPEYPSDESHHVIKANGNHAAVLTRKLQLYPSGDVYGVTIDVDHVSYGQDT